MNKIMQDKKIFRLLIIGIIIVILMSILTKGRFLYLKNLSSMLFLIPELGILSLGIMMAMIIGGIDLSLVSIANLSSILATMFILYMDGSFIGIFLGIMLGLLVGAICGFINGFLISRIKVHPILVTLGTFQLFQGIAVVITKGYAITNLPESFINFGNGTILFIPIPFIALFVVWQFVSFLLNKTGFGQSLYLIGTNYKASKLSGLNSDKIINTTYTIVGIIGAIAGLIMVARTNSAKSDYGLSYTLQSILVCMLGGVNWSGGVGKSLGIIISVFILQFLSSGFSLMRYSNFFKDFTSGMFLLFILIFYYYMSIYDENKSKKLLKKDNIGNVK